MVDQGGPDCFQIILIGAVLANVVMLEVGAMAGDGRRWPAAGRGVKEKKQGQRTKHNQTLQHVLLAKRKKGKKKQEAVNSIGFVGVLVGRSMRSCRK